MDETLHSTREKEEFGSTGGKQSIVSTIFLHVPFFSKKGTSHGSSSPRSDDKPTTLLH